MIFFRYNIPSFLNIPEKMQQCAQNLIPPPGPQPTLSISFFSASGVPWALPPLVAKGLNFGLFGIEGVNSKLVTWLLGQLGNDALQVAASEEKQGTDAASDVGVQAPRKGPRIRGW